MFLGDVTWEDVKAQLGTTDLLIYPLGALETYGTALPLGTEAYVVDHLARELGKRTGGLVMPTLPFAWSVRNLGFPGSVAIAPELIRDYVVQSCGCLAEFGVRRVFFVNGHGPNRFPVEEASRALGKQQVKCAQIDLWRFVMRLSRDLLQDPDGGSQHASEMAASMLLAIRPELVRSDRYQVGATYDTLEVRFPDVELHLISPEKGPLGHYGDPSPATAAKGEEIIRRTLGRFEEIIAAWR